VRDGDQATLAVADEDHVPPPEGYVASYWKRFPNIYFTGDESGIWTPPSRTRTAGRSKSRASRCPSARSSVGYWRWAAGWMTWRAAERRGRLNLTSTSGERTSFKETEQSIR
jgi:hypothetical protein